MINYEIVEREEQPMTVKKENDIRRIVYRVTAGQEDLSDIALFEIAREITDLEEEKEHFHALTIFFWKDSDPVGEFVARASVTYAPGGEWDSLDRTNQEDYEGYSYRIDFNRYNQL